MPYSIRKLPNQNLYRVYNKETNKIHSYATSLENAKKQVKLLYTISGEGIETDAFEEKEVVTLPEFSSVKVDLPTYMYKRLPNINGKPPPYRYRLVNPITETRNIASRKNSGKSVEINRKPIPQPFTYYEESNETPKLKDFSPEDQEKLKQFYEDVKKNEGKDRDKIKQQPAENIPRGYPVTMYKTAKRLGFKETDEKVYQKKPVIVKPPKEKKVKIPKEKKPRGRPKKEKVTIEVQEEEQPFSPPTEGIVNVEFPPSTPSSLSRASSTKSSISPPPSLSRASSTKSSISPPPSLSRASSTKSSVSPPSSLSRSATESSVSSIDMEELMRNLRNKTDEIIGGSIKNKILTNNKMNSWVQYVKDYAAQNNMKYNEALKDPACKAGYKGLGGKAYKKGAGIIDEAAAAGYADQVLIADAYNQSELGANAGKKYISL
jgi:hypothetical protein